MRSQSSSPGSDALAAGAGVARSLSIVHVCRVGWPHTGGMEAVVGGLASALARRGHRVRVVTLDRAPQTGEPLPPGVFGGVWYDRVPRRGPARYPAGAGLTRRLADADIVHVHGVDGLLAQVIAGRGRHGARVGVTPHGAFLHTRRQWWLKQAWLRTGAGATLRAADAVWFTSAAERDALGPAGVIGEVLPNGVDVDRFGSIRRAPEPGRWLALGRVDAHKGLDTLIDRLAAVATHDPRPFQLRIAGAQASVGLVDALRGRAVHHGIGHRVRFLGPIDDEALRVELARCELAFFPSRFEAFGIALVEAMAAGVPVVANDIPAFRELIDDGETGFIIDFSASAGSRALRALRGALPAEIPAARRAVERFGWRARVSAFEVAYASLLAST